MKKLFHLCEDDLADAPLAQILPNIVDSSVQVSTRTRRIGLEWDERRLDTKCNTNALYCNEAQRHAIAAIHDSGRQFAQVFTTGPLSQERARHILQENGLDDGSLSMLESRWSRTTQRSWDRVEGRVERVVYQWYLYT
ncbi:uncharacterized protein B0H18DRAFT_1052950 [Fomitopsis serialis]|uniref:uncharacterized protein n=1 Tax=Fomitopsis serialis TaxID=139415 RepID=UPI0020078EEA|nr:uncharacterized protein B0H18DRAFT_1052950 [Neoantrodia serialis]KAH9912645.1 hypothetical protein B0H18DRAFT_1052950 [Neoantrodia serialis]